MGNTLLSIRDLTRYQFNLILETAHLVKRQPRRYRERMKQRTIAQVCAEGDFRDRICFQIAIEQLGGTTVQFTPKIGAEDEPRDIARTLERWTNGIMVAIPDHAVVVEMADAVEIPVFNGGSARHDPILGLTGMFTLQQLNRDLGSLKIALLNASTAMINSWAAASAHVGCRLVVHARPGADLQGKIFEPGTTGGESGFDPAVVTGPEAALAGADIIVTPAARPDSREAGQFDAALLETANPGAVVLPGLPAGDCGGYYRDLIDASKSPAFKLMENKLHIQKAIVVLLYERQL